MRQTTKQLTLFAGLLLSFQAFAQDIIVKTDASIIRAIVNEIDETSIVYHQWDNQSGPAFRISIEKVARIQFQNGVEQSFSSIKTNSESTATASLSAYNKLEYLGHGDYRMGQIKMTDQYSFSTIPGIDDYIATYNSAQRQRRWGKTLIPIGAAAMGIGAVFTGVALSEAPTTMTYTKYWDSTGKTWDNSDVDGDIYAFQSFMTVASIFLGIGSVCLSIGIPLNIVGSSRLRWIADDYNDRRGYSANLRIGQTPNGYGLALNF